MVDSPLTTVSGEPNDRQQHHHEPDGPEQNAQDGRCRRIHRKRHRNTEKRRHDRMDDGGEGHIRSKTGRRHESCDEDNSPAGGKHGHKRSPAQALDL